MNFFKWIIILSSWKCKRISKYSSTNGNEIRNSFEVLQRLKINKKNVYLLLACVVIKNALKMFNFTHQKIKNVQKIYFIASKSCKILFQNFVLLASFTFFIQNNCEKKYFYGDWKFFDLQLKLNHFEIKNWNLLFVKVTRTWIFKIFIWSMTITILSKPTYLESSKTQKIWNFLFEVFFLTEEKQLFDVSSKTAV